MLENTDLRGVVAASITPVTEGFEIDVARLKSHMEFMLKNGCSYVSEFGTTGEGASFSSRQKISVLETFVASGMDMKLHIPGVVASSVDEAALLFSAIAKVGARAALVIPPYYYTPPSPKAVVDFYDAMIARAGTPDIGIVLYNFPYFSGVRFDVALVELMLERFGSRIVGIKDSTGDLNAGLALVKAFPQLSIFTGDDRILPEMVAAGGAGMIGGMTNIYPVDTVRLYTGPVSDALRQQAKVRIEAVDGHGGGPVLKALVSAMLGDDAYALAVPPLQTTSAAVMTQVLETVGGVPKP